MTFKEAMLKELTGRGMFETQAMEVLSNYIEEDESMEGRWHQNVGSYPDSLQTILWSGVKKYAYEWVVVNAPEAWFRPMFQYSDEELKLVMSQN